MMQKISDKTSNTLQHAIISTLLLLIMCFHFGITNAEPIAGPSVGVAEKKDKGNNFIVSIQMKDNLLHRRTRRVCTGTLLSQKHVLTAASCLTDENLINRIEVRLASCISNKCPSYHPEQWISYDKWAKDHPADTIEYEENNIAIIKLSKKIVENVKKTKLNEKEEKKLPWRFAQMVGWLDQGPDQISLQLGATTIRDQGFCYNRVVEITGSAESYLTSFICTQTDQTMGTEGDLGAPLLFRTNEIVGVFRGVLARNAPAADNLNIFTSVQPYRRFIDSILSKK